ncbi:hypothetical protein FRC01_006719, partial [Tulasnella sp. 417]
MACASIQGIKPKFEDPDAGGEDAVAYQAVAWDFLLLPEEWEKQGPSLRQLWNIGEGRKEKLEGAFYLRASKKHLRSRGTRNRMNKLPWKASLTARRR